MEWFFDTFFLQRKLQELRQRTADLAHIQIGDKVLDAGCGTGTLAILAAARVGATGQASESTRARNKSLGPAPKLPSGNLPIEFRVGVIEHLEFPDQTFAAVLSTIMMHHLSDTLKRQGLAEIFRVLKPGGPPGHC